MKSVSWIAAVIMLVTGGGEASGQSVDACAVLTSAEWEAALGPAFYGPESRQLQSKHGNTSTSACTYNFVEVLLRRPTDAGDEADLREYLENSLRALAAADSEGGHEWSVNVESLGDLGVPAAVGWVVAQEGSEIAGAEVYYIVALPRAGEPTLLEVRSPESVDEARTIAGLFVEKLG